MVTFFSIHSSQIGGLGCRSRCSCRFQFGSRSIPNAVNYNPNLISAFDYGHVFDAVDYDEKL